ncbi:hypothetical protein Zmor_011188 [Zophobas morio]|uniref:Chitin-binding type-2 domain-containing protein n=1 Tax=Zophobas morio TaxID=2755281 RepID=A0AA38IKA4_9CUCU|nr:hypothetical protein Zmor_011188 [Zophobas morio]
MKTIILTSVVLCLCSTIWVTISEPVSDCPAVEGQFPTFITDRSNCSVFYMCAHGIPVLKVCPNGLFFNPALEVCDWPQNAGCEPELEECLAG